MTKENQYTIIGIDGGGTRTRGILKRGDEIIARSNSGTTRIGAVGVGESCERLLNVITDLCDQSEIDSTELDAVVIGLAGVWLEEEKMRSAKLLRTLARGQDMAFNDLQIISDAELALEGAFGGDNGVIVIVGTGSISVGKIGKGKLVRCGGWGIELDDEGSGAWIGKEGLTAVVRAIDGRGKSTILVEKLTELFPTISIDEPRTIVKAYSERSFEYQMLTPIVMQAAEGGDEVSLNIIKRSANHLMELLTALAPHYKTKSVPVALMGGIIDADTLLAKLLDEKIKISDKFVRIEPKGSALDGAISFGKQMIEQSL